LKTETTKISEASAIQPTCTWRHHAETESTLILPDFTLNVLAVENDQTAWTTEVVRREELNLGLSVS
jgi:hypothetical protein